MCEVSVLFNESKLLKSSGSTWTIAQRPCFSTLQRVEIAEMNCRITWTRYVRSFSTLQRVEIAEICCSVRRNFRRRRFSTLQRVEIAEI